MAGIAPELPGQLAYEGKFQWLTRLGFAARGLLYIVIGVLAFRTGRTEDLTGALEYVGHGAGKILLIVLAAGLATYGLWRLSDAFLGTEHGSGSWKAFGKRGMAGGIGVVYLYLGYKACRILFDGRAGTSGVEQNADTVLDLPGGTLVLFMVSLGLAIAAGNQFWKTVTANFVRHLREGAAQQELICWLGRLGYAARGIIFLVVAWLMFRAAADHTASEAGNIEKALDVLRGPYLLPIVGGLMLFGLFSLVEARFRAIHKPPVEKVKREVREKMTP